MFFEGGILGGSSELCLFKGSSQGSLLASGDVALFCCDNSVEMLITLLPVCRSVYSALVT